MDKPLADVSAEMAVDKDEPIAVRDGAILRANIFRPGRPGKYPVIMSMGIYGKDVHFADAYKPQWEALKRLQPAIDADGSSGRYLRWELPDPERWVPHGYVVIAIDSRGSLRARRDAVGSNGASRAAVLYWRYFDWIDYRIVARDR